jgi:raffinose/stachyose/melibiose transport system permease protein
MLFADMVVITIPPLIMFMLFQRKIVSRMTACAIKG